MMIPTIIYIDCTKFPDPEFVVEMTSGELVENSVKTNGS